MQTSPIQPRPATSGKRYCRCFVFLFAVLVCTQVLAGCWSYTSAFTKAAIGAEQSAAGTQGGSDVGAGTKQ